MEQTIKQVNTNIEYALGELDYTMVDNAYVQVVQAIFSLAPYAKWVNITSKHF